MTRTEDDNEWPTLRPGDEVEVVLPGVVTPTGVIKPTDLDYRFDPTWLKTRGVRVTVTRSFDHPSRDLVGTVRGANADVWIKVDRYGGHSTDDAVGGIWWNVMTGEERTHDDVEEWPVIGVTPRTPAWDEQVAKEGDHT